MIPSRMKTTAVSLLVALIGVVVMRLFSETTAMSVLVALIGVGVMRLFSDGSERKEAAPDHAFFRTTVPLYQPPSLLAPVQHEPYQRWSEYVTMSDGVRLAVDVYLPANYSVDDDKNDGLPTFLHLTRYHRADQRSWFLGRFLSLFGEGPADYFPTRPLPYLQTLVASSNYALVSVDVRGTGASFGSRPVDLLPREVQDYVQVAQWVHAQPWCNGRVASGGISYDGMTAALLAGATVLPDHDSNDNDKEQPQSATTTTQRPLVQAVALLFAPGDLYEDLCMPGGIVNTGFLDWYHRFTKASERNEPVVDTKGQLPWAFKLLVRLLFPSTMPVDPQDTAELDRAVQGHADNFDMLTAGKQMTAKDSVVKKVNGVDHIAQDLGITQQTYNGLIRNKVAVYSVAGYYDSGSVRSSARLHNYLTKHGSDPRKTKLTIGPWTHGARAAWTPHTNSTKPSYPLFQDVQRFLDCHLRDECTNSVATEAPLHYFVSGADEWRNSTDLWPPQEGLQWQTLPLSRLSIQANGTDLTIPPSDKDNNDKSSPVWIEYKIDFAATTGLVSRWNLVQHIMKRVVSYPDRAQQLQHTLGFSIKAFDDGDWTLVGSPQVSLSLALHPGASDTAIFAYLDEIDPVSGVVHYITEGSLRASHRVVSSSTSDKTTTMERIGSMDAFPRSYLYKDLQPLQGSHTHNNEDYATTRIEFLLEPIAYVIPKGHVLRLSLAGADVDNYYLDNIPNLATTWFLDVAQSHLRLPLRKEE